MDVDSGDISQEDPKGSPREFTTMNRSHVPEHGRHQVLTGTNWPGKHVQNELMCDVNLTTVVGITFSGIVDVRHMRAKSSNRQFELLMTLSREYK